MRILGKCFALQIFLPKSNIVICQPVVLERLDILSCQEDIIVAKIGLLGSELL